MKLMIIRHAAAIERNKDISDEQRFLTAEGRSFFRKTARTMLKNGVEPCLILSSPLVRAVQTADILAETLSFIGPVAVKNELAPGFNLESLQRLLASYRHADELVIVGHEPDLGTILSSLLSLPSGYTFRKGDAVMLKLDKKLQEPASFKWMATGKKLIDSRREAFAPKK